MAKALKNIVVILKPQNTDELINLIPNLCRWLKKRERKVVFHIKEKERLQKVLSPKSLKECYFSEPPSLYSQADLIITLGGDGTLIGLCRKLKSSTPVFGINRGNLGFITEFGQSDFYDNLQDVINGKFKIEKKSLFTAEIHRSNKVAHKESFFNDAVITKNDIARMFSLSVYSDDDHVYDVSGDGLIISSPIGSTAYSLAAGGPIVNPNVKAMILTPISAHGLSHRPLVLEDSSIIKIKAIPPFESVILTIDGQKAIEIKKNDLVVIKKQRKSIHFIKNNNRSYYRTLKEKFGHGK